MCFHYSHNNTDLRSHKETDTILSKTGGIYLNIKSLFSPAICRAMEDISGVVSDVIILFVPPLHQMARRLGPPINNKRNVIPL